MSSEIRHRRHGAAPGSAGARRIGDAHRGSQTHDQRGGFGADGALARAAGRRGGLACSAKYGRAFYRQIGRVGGEKCARVAGADFYSKIGRRGGLKRAENLRRRKEELANVVDGLDGEVV